MKKLNKKELESTIGGNVRYFTDEYTHPTISSDKPEGDREIQNDPIDWLAVAGVGGVLIGSGVIAFASISCVRNRRAQAATVEPGV